MNDGCPGNNEIGSEALNYFRFLSNEFYKRRALHFEAFFQDRIYAHGDIARGSGD